MSNVSYLTGDKDFVFGYFRKSDNGKNLLVNGTDKYKADDCTNTAIGTGKNNTLLLVNTRGDAAYRDSSGSSKTAAYAAKLCYDLVYGGYDDWFLPSKDELNLMYTNLKTKGLGALGTHYYWSSSEYHITVDYGTGVDAWFEGFDYGNQFHGGCGNRGSIRPIRAFLDTPDNNSQTVSEEVQQEKSQDESFEDIVIAAYNLSVGQHLEGEVTLSGMVIDIPIAYSAQYKYMTVEIQVGSLDTKTITCYRLSGEGCEKISIGDVIIVRGQLENYKGMIEFNKPILISIGK